MKPTTLPAKIFSLIVCMALLGGLFSIDANAQGVFQKRKYRKGFYVDFGKTPKVTTVEESGANFTALDELEIDVKPVVAVEEQAYELPFQSEQLAYENVEAPQFASVKENEVKGNFEFEASQGQLAINSTAKKSGFSERQVAKWNMLRDKLDPLASSEEAETAPYLRKALVLALIGFVFLLLAGLLGASWGLGWLLWLVGSILLIIALVFFILWIVAAA